MSHLNDHRSTVSLVERYVGTAYDKLMELLKFLPELLELLEYFRNYTGVVDARLTFSQSTPASVWIIPHNLLKFPSIETVDSSLTEMEGEVVHIDNNNLTITFNKPVSGFAYIN